MTGLWFAMVVFYSAAQQKSGRGLRGSNRIIGPDGMLNGLDRMAQAI